MNTSLPPEAAEYITREIRHFELAPAAFFQAWKRGVELIGPEWFGDGTHEGLQRATDKRELAPKLLLLGEAHGVLGSGQAMFLAAMVSFYQAAEGGAMLRRSGFRGLADLQRLDSQQRQVIADLLLNYVGWC